MSTDLRKRAIRESDITFIPFADAVTPPSGLCCCIRDRWWIVHPEKGLAVYRGISPQCNSHEAIARRLAPMYPWAEVRFIPIAFMEHDCNE